jgi:hypothetical protein
LLLAAAAAAAYEYQQDLFTRRRPASAFIRIKVIRAKHKI